MNLKYVLLTIFLLAFTYRWAYVNGQKDIPLPKISPTVIPTNAPIDLSDRKLWSLIQEWRQSESRQPYIEDQRLCVIANDRVNDGLLDKHQGLYDKYSSYPFMLQENLSRDYNEKDTLTGWLASPGHAETLRKPYKASCVRCEGMYCVQIFSNLDY